MADQKPSFVVPLLNANPVGWGPALLLTDSTSSVTETAVLSKNLTTRGSDVAYLEDIPYQPFSKSDRLGKIADWSGDVRYADRRYNMRYQQYGTGSAFSYYHDEDDSSFNLVDRSGGAFKRSARGGSGGGNGGGGSGGNRFQRGGPRSHRDPRNNRDQKNDYTTLGKDRKWNKHNAAPGRGRKGGKTQFRRYGVYRHYNDAPKKLRDASVEVQADWKVLSEMDFSALNKLATDMSEVVPEELGSYGKIEYFDKGYERVTTRSAVPLQQIPRSHTYVTTTDDPVIRELSSQKKGNVFATDAILSALMCCTRSVYSFDILVQRVGDFVFLDKRDDSFDYLTVNETAQEQQEESQPKDMNTPSALSMESTYINQNFSQQVLKRSGQTHDFGQPNPFATAMASEEVPSAGFRYRSWKMSDDITLVARTQVDGMREASGSPQFVSIKSLNEFDPAVGENWRAKLDTQRGAVLATELKNNSFKLAKWTCSALLGNVQRISIGYVSRVHAADEKKHVILGTQSLKTSEMAMQIGLKMHNAWGILRTIIDIVRKHPEGKYLLLKDPNNPILRLYGVPANAFEEPEEESDGGENPFHEA